MNKSTRSRFFGRRMLLMLKKTTRQFFGTAGLLVQLGKRITKNVYAKTREECEKKLMVLIAQMDQKILAQKARMAKDIE